MESIYPAVDATPRPPTAAQAMLLAVLACIATTALATPLLGYLDLANIVMLFLLTVLLVAVKLGRNAAILASVLSVLFFDVFFVPPRFSLAVSNLQYLVTFAVMLATALIASHLTTGLRQRAEEAQVRERRTQALYEVARKLAGTHTAGQVFEIVGAFVKAQFGADACLLLPDAQNKHLSVFPGGPQIAEMHLARVAYDSGELVRSDEVAAMGYASLYLPLHGATRMRGVLAVRFAADAGEPQEKASAVLHALASLVAVAIERQHYVDVAQRNEVRMLTERLRSSILSALSHDLRTPLTAMVGLADSLFLIKPPLPASALETAQTLHEQADRLASLVGNLLDMARLNAGEVTLRPEWQPLEEIVGASIKLLGNALSRHPVRVQLPRDLPLLEFDAVLIERVLCNLLENAAKYAPDDSTIELSANDLGDAVEIVVADQGPGLPANGMDELFEMFVRGRNDTGKPGSGLGLAICKAIVEAHGGHVTAGNRPEGGARLGFTLPKGNPPVVEAEEAA